MCRDGRVVVKPGGDQGEEDPDALIRCNRNFQQFFEDADLFGTVSALLFALISNINGTTESEPSSP